MWYVYVQRFWGMPPIKARGQRLRKVSAADRARLEEEGRWRLFWTKRAVIAKERGYATAAEATAETLLLFPPLDLSKPTPPVPTGRLTPVAQCATGADGLHRADFEGRDCTERVAVQWALGNIDLVDVTPADAPSSFAWSLLVRLQANAGLYQSMLTTAMARLMPSQTELDRERKRRDDGRALASTQQELIDTARRVQGLSVLPPGA